MSHIIDRRLNAKNKSAVNRQRFLQRYREHIKKAVADAMAQRSITDMEQGEKISIPSRDVQEPDFQHGRGGRRENVLPRSEEHTSELQSRGHLVCRPLLAEENGHGEPTPV